MLAGMSRIFIFSVLCVVSFYGGGAGQAFAQTINGAGTVIRSDGTKGHFIVGTFDTIEECRENVFKMVEMITGQARWVGQRFTYKLEECVENFRKGTIFEALAKLSGLENYTLIHPHFRLTILSPDGKKEEQELCEVLAGYFRSLLGGRALCAAPADGSR